MDVLIRNIPEDVVSDVKQMASVAIERYYRDDLHANQLKALQDAFRESVDAFREANGLPKKFDVEK